MESFAKAAAKATDVKAALRDPRILNVLLPALGLPDAVGQPGLALRALTADPKKSDGLLARLPDTPLEGRGRDAEPARARHRGAARPEGAGDARGRAAAPGVAERARRGAGRRRRRDAVPRARGTAKTAYDVLGDPVLRRVLTAALGLPQGIVVQSVEAQARALPSGEEALVAAPGR